MSLKDEVENFVDAHSRTCLEGRGVETGATHPDSPLLKRAIEALEYIAKHGANFNERLDTLAEETLQEIREVQESFK